MQKESAQANYRYIVITLAIALIAFLIGFSLGFHAAMKIMIDEAAKFIDVDRNLIQEYLCRMGEC